MELQTVLICLGAGVAGIAVLLLLVSLFSASGTSYEEAVAQQRRVTGELLALANNKQKPNKKNKKAVKKTKDKKPKESVVTGSEHDSDAQADSDVQDEPIPTPAAPSKGHVEFGAPIVVDVPRDTPPNVKIRKRGKDPKVKPILLNKEDPSCVSDVSVPPSPSGSSLSNNFEEIHPKDEFELMHSSFASEKVVEKKVEEVIEKKEAKGNKGGKGKSIPKVVVQPETPKDEPEPILAPPVLSRERRASGDGPKEQRKGKKEKKTSVEEVVEAVEQEVVAPLNTFQPSELTTDKLLKNALPQPAPLPAAAPSTNKKKNKKADQNIISLMAGDAGGVNVAELVRLVSEATLSRTELQILTDALLNKQHGPLPEHSEWSEGPNDPVQKLKKQLAEKEKALVDEQEASQAVHAKLKELRASLNAERSRASALARTAEEATAAYKVETHALHARLQRLVDENHAIVQEKMMIQSKLNAEGDMQAQRVQLEMHIQRLSDTEAALLAQLGVLQAEAGARALEAGQARCEAAAARDASMHAQQQLAELAQQLQEANRVCAELEAQRQTAAHNEQRLQQDLRQLNDRLSGMSELQAEVQRLTSRAQQAEQKADKIAEEANREKQQLSSEVKSLREQLALKEEALAERQALHPTQNGLMPSEQQKAGELAKVEAVVEGLRVELETARRASSEQRELAARLQTQLQTYQDKNNEAVSSAIETQFRETAALLRSACPAAAPSDSAPGRPWLEAFAASLKASAPAPQTSNNSELEARLSQLESNNDHLQGLVDKYKRIIDDTEGVLSRLQQNVSQEEQRWAQQLADKQLELDQLKQHSLTQMQSKIDALQSELNLERANNHSLADSERLNEENIRLMAGIPDKHKLDALNGPSTQVGLEEK